MLYEDQETLAEFSRRYDIGYPPLSDPGSKVIRMLGLFNETYEPGTKYYGVPYPGVFLVDTNGVIVQKFAEESYRDRPLIDDLLDAVRNDVHD